MRTHFPPPAPDAFHGEFRGVVIAAYADPAFIASNVVDSVWDGFSKLRVGKVVDVDLFRLALWTPLPTCVFELPDKFLFLGIDADDWLVFA